MGELPNSSLAGPASLERQSARSSRLQQAWEGSGAESCAGLGVFLSPRNQAWTLLYIMTSETKAKDDPFQGADFGMWLKGKWSCRWRTINFWTFLMCCRGVPLGCEIKCKSGWAQKQIAACNLLSVRIITYIFIFLININAELDHIHRTFIHSWFPLSFTLIVPYPWARQMEIFMRLKSSNVHWARLSWQTNCITHPAEYVATPSPFCCTDGAEDIFRGSRVRVVEKAMNLLLCIPGCTICYAQFSSWFLWYVFH